jgi:tRNA pseudouridine38-40 synthase
MARYFLEVAYKGTRFSGFQVQENATTIQGEVQKAFATLQRQPVSLTGSSRTDAGVHARQNFFHFDFDSGISNQFLYKINAILPPDISVLSLKEVPPTAHSRFDAVSREYEYRIYSYKNPFLKGLACYYPYKIDLEAMQEAAALVKDNSNFSAFCKSNSQVSNYQCTIIKSQWIKRDELLVYNVQANRFLRGMVRMLTATMLQVGRGKMTLNSFKNYFLPHFSPTTHSTSAEGLYLIRVDFPPISKTL